MAKQIATREPTEVFINSAWAWDATYPDFRADESWQLNYYVRGPDDLDVAWGTYVAAASSGPTFEVRVPASITNGLTDAGAYRLIGRMTKSGDVHDGEVVYNEHLLVKLDPVDAVSAKSHNRQMLEALRTARLATTGSEKAEVSVNGRRVVYRSPDELDRQIARYEYLVAIEENPNGRVEHAVEFSRV